MNPSDVLVGAVSAVAGSLGVLAGISNCDACYQTTKVQWLVQRFGRTRTRMLYVLGGLFFIVLGIAIASGFAVNRIVPSGEGRAWRPDRQRRLRTRVEPQSLAALAHLSSSDIWLVAV
ncbi:MAG: hypothetical protein AB7F89_19710 [Pirellulaceae bacterium]